MRVVLTREMDHIDEKWGHLVPGASTKSAMALDVQPTAPTLSCRVASGDAFLVGRLPRLQDTALWKASNQTAYTSPLLRSRSSP